MPTIQKLIPVQRSAPPPRQPLEARPGERKEDFQQHLDDATTTNKPTKPSEAAVKPGKAEAKKSAGKAAGSGKPKGRADAKRDADEVADSEANASDPAHAEPGDVRAAEDGDAEAGGAHADGEVGHNAMRAKDANADGEHADGATDAATAEAALAQTASAVKPVTATNDEQQKNGQDGQQSAKQDASVSAAAKAGSEAAGAPNGPPSARVKAVAKDDSDEASADPGDPTAALADAVLKASGGAKEQGSEDQAGEQPASGAARKLGEAKSPEASWGAPVPEFENKPLKAHATATATPATAPMDATAAASAAAASAAAQASAVAGAPSGDEKDAKSTVGAGAGKALTVDATAAAAGQAQGPQAGTPAHQATSVPASPPPEVQFAETNHEPIVTGVKAQLLPHGGSMQIRLDPPELGALKVMVEMRDGAMTATFQTSNEEATRLLSHSLNQLKHVLEGQGVSVECLQVRQAPKGESASSGGNNDDAKRQQNQQNWQDEHAARQEQQRKEVLRRMWRRVAGMSDPIDVTA